VRRADQVAGLLLLVFAIWYATVAVANYPYASSTGPGSGFLPFWLGVIMAVLAALLVLRAPPSRGESGTGWLPRGRGLVRFAAVVVATGLFIALLRVLGMNLATLLFLVGILRFVEGYRWASTLAIAVGTTAVNYLVFTYWLRVPFPTGVLGF
jgi:hypothetical protein